MKNIYTLVFILSFSIISKAQYKRDYGVAFGFSNYLGDIGGKEKTRRDFLSDVKLAKTRWNIGGFVRTKIKPKISLKLALDYLRIEGDDKKSSNPARNARNLSFKNDMYDLGLTAEYFFFENNDLGNTYRFKNGFRAYVFGGIGAFLSNPKANYNGEWVKLQPLRTEGVAYSTMGLNIPMGVGFYFTLSKKHRIGFEYNYRKTFTDYLDDIGGNYGDPRNMTPEGKALSNRTGEISGLDPAFVKNFGFDETTNTGNKRGDSKHKDSYMTIGFNYSYVIRGKSSFYRGHYGGFFGKGKGKSKGRKIRAKF